ncbi:GNAT family N-acetyltransferase [Marinivivus vitaminiproducens]|uniref:GNAT family N-acetyltransferase n=1 Tax=Marinivivus vitaminiproducens TaxID=3035935 RepID=UPI0027A03A10|nr:GNAT family N-acetyltransferase [Geminicoccaceae bacterium SCSIO 64248]
MDLHEITPADAARAARVINLAYRGDRPGWTHESALFAGRRTDGPAIETMLAADDTHILALAADAEDGLAGCVCLQQRDAASWYLSLLAVHPSYQARGVGKRLMAGAEDFVRRAGGHRAHISVVSVRSELIAWYERRGYERTGELEPFPYHDPSVGKPLRDDLALVRMAKRL